MDKVFIIDDSLLNIQLIKEILQTDYQIESCSDSENFIDSVTCFNPDLIILDVLMPHKDGFLICKELKENETLKNIPIIFITSKNFIDDKLKGFSCGAQDYISRPFYAKEVVERVRVHIELKKSREESEHCLIHLEEKNKRLLELTKIDFLTGVSNRRYILERIKEEILRSTENKKIFSLAICDIDHFKNVNDSYGHEVGDIILKDLAQEIKKNLKSEDILARWGGEEFLILLPDKGLTEAYDSVEFIRKKISQYSCKYKQINIIKTITIGVTEFDLNESIEVNINNADAVMYLGKKTGRNRVEVYRNQELSHG